MLVRKVNTIPVSMLTLTFSLKHRCAWIQPHQTASMAVYPYHMWRVHAAGIKIHGRQHYSLLYVFLTCYSDRHHVAPVTLYIVSICGICSQYVWGRQSFDITAVSKFKDVFRWGFKLSILSGFPPFFSFLNPKTSCDRTCRENALRARRMHITSVFYLKSS